MCIVSNNTRTNMNMESSFPSFKAYYNLHCFSRGNPSANLSCLFLTLSRLIVTCIAFHKPCNIIVAIRHTLSRLIITCIVSHEPQYCCNVPKSYLSRLIITCIVSHTESYLDYISRRQKHFQGLL